MKMLNKNIAREFKSSLARYISVSALLMLGVFVFIGLNVTGPNMRRTAQRVYTAEHLADAKVSSTIALTAKDRATIQGLQGIKTVEYAHTKDVLIKGSHKAIRVQSNPHTLSKLTLTKGRRAAHANEIVLSNQLRDQYQLGSRIQLVAGKVNASSGLRHHTYTVVGFATSSEYLKKDKLGDSSLGNGTLSGFAYTTKAAFSSTQPNMARLVFKQAKGTAYSDSYEHHAAGLVTKLQKTLNRRNQTRVVELRRELTRTITTAQHKLTNSRHKLGRAVTQIDTGQKQLDTQLAQAKIAHSTVAIAQLKLKQQQLDQRRKLLANQQDQLKAAQTKIDNAKVTKRQLKDVSLTIESRNDYNGGYNNYGEDAARIDSLGKSFPAFFFLIAILVSFTMMRRMVAEKRIEMGTLRALGYSKGAVMREFLIYSVSTALTGTFLGSILGLFVLPRVIFRAYTANFNFTNLQLSWHPVFVLIGLGLALLSTVLASWLAARAALKVIPADLMLPKPPANGSRIWLERLTPIWQKMSFSHKVTARNLFRYKSRMFMTIVGVAGATALMITGFGIRDSLNTIVNRQFGQISRYDLVAIYNPEGKPNAVKKAKRTVTNNDNVRRTTTAHFDTVYATTSQEETREEISLMVSFSPSKLDQYVKLRDYQTGRKLKLTNTGAIVSQKLAKLQRVSVGDHMSIKDSDGTAHRIKVAGITTMYAGHDIYMNRTYYNRSYHDHAIANAFLVTLKDASVQKTNALAARFNRQQAAVETVQSRESKRTITNILSNLNNLILVLVLSASLLSLVVLYTLTNINVSERVRELSTLKVLGFYPNEVLMYIYRETNILTGVGILTGIGVGYTFHAYIMGLLPPSTAMVAPGLTWLNVAISVVLTIVFSIVVMALMNHKIQSVDMLAALKSVD